MPMPLGYRKRSPEEQYTMTSWYGMVQRCTNTWNPDYKDYGGRGITLHPLWLVFENFLADVGLRPEGMSIDRIDNDGNYEPGNVRWATPKEQASNRRPLSVSLKQNKSACLRGHLYDEKNTYWHNGKKYCRECNAASARRRKSLLK